MTYSVVDVAGINRISAKILANAAGTLVGMATEPSTRAGRSAPARRGLHVGRHDAVRDSSPRAARGGRIRRARLSSDGHRRRLDGGADQDRPRRRRPGRHSDGARRRARGRHLAGWSRTARGRRPPRDSPGRLPRRARPDCPRPSRLDARSVSAPAGSTTTTSTWLQRERRRRRAPRSQRSSRESSMPPPGPVALFIPLRGLSPLSTPGAEFHDAAADAALVEGLRALIDPSRVEMHEADCDINDPGARASDGRSPVRAHGTWLRPCPCR